MGDLIYYDSKCDRIRLCPAAGQTNANGPYGSATSQVGACDMPWVWNSSTPNLAGSYNFNGWLYNGDAGDISSYRGDVAGAVGFVFANEAAIQKPSLTPMIADAVWVDFWPAETDPPFNNLYTGNGDGNPAELERAIIPRHGWKNPSQAPQNFNISSTLPGGTDLGMSDGHVETPRLEQMWTYSWHKNWVIPNPRPGR
jgi:hypothetical protein